MWYVDALSIKGVNDGLTVARKAWVKIDYSAVKSVPERTAKVLVFLDCLGEKSKTTTWVTYKADGSVLADRSSRYPAYENVVPETVMSAILQEVCAVDLL